jgi:hypothetical protein
MAAISLFWYTNMAAVTSDENDLYYGFSCNLKKHIYENPPPGNLPTTRTQGATPFEVLGVDFAAPTSDKRKNSKEDLLGPLWVQSNESCAFGRATIL